MSVNEGEKFLLEYWQFKEPDISNNATVALIAAQPLRPVIERDNERDYFIRHAIRDIFQRRGYQCPGGTRSCISIDRPNSCCGSNDVCTLIEDTGLGDVGCCASGSDCRGTISQCDTGAGYSSCPDSPNGGCCIPGYSCQDVGCIAVNTQIVTRTFNPPPSSSTTPPPSSPPPSNSPSSSLSCSPGFRSCPASQGGGCCATDRACGSHTCPALSTGPPTSAGAAPPVRPTSESGLITTGPETSAGPDACPTGFYMCSAYYRGGCCRVGRNCDSTSCPATNTEILNTNGITIGAPAGATVAPIPSPSCATGWFICGADEGSGCCPTGYSCGSGDTCMATESGAPNVAKEPPSMAASGNRVCWCLLTIAWFSGVAMLLL
ncbi:hypothetical protein EJ05DRAFT_299780 [Pseudovirgaria hyperparasitica]|uniref:GPI anchored protein n=1 Tax=Pseudovirgaria hyperparasitica TaxID=470096 RepID=A0A6A6WA88_9PEZI|nr:uncharacterized protein EJ05DRAFT_299780 [Pseudovirgaria hyperparasitica]KAF2759485.1 hypothetical protein EJ05DRAFT_299780 [Pseudovirgaria hyperparasitica]